MFFPNDNNCLLVVIADIFGISDHNLMYTQEAVETPEEISNAVHDQAIEARVSFCVCLLKGKIININNEDNDFDDDYLASRAFNKLSNSHIFSPEKLAPLPKN